MSQTIDTTLRSTIHHHATGLQSIELGANATRYEALDLATIEDLIEVEALHQPLLGRDVLVKRLSSEGNALARVRRAFLQEVRATAMLRHPNLAQVYEAGGQAELPYVVVERVAGVTLHEHLDMLYDNGDALGVDAIRSIIDTVAEVVEYAQQQGVRVYSLEPSNIVLTGSGTVVLSSLGMAPVEIERLTPMQLAYLAPEYVRGDLSDQRAMVYGLGALLAHLLSGAAPFEGSSVAIIAQKERAQNAPRLFTHGLAPDALALLQLARAALHPDVRQRPITVPTFRELLAGVATAETHASALPAALEGPPAAHKTAPQRSAPNDVPSEDTFVMPPMGDPTLVPGMERAEFQAALPFTVLVPLPAVAAVAAPAAPAGALAPHALSSSVSQHLWVLLLLAVVVSVGAAMMLG
ncbi:MAG: protein kinase [Chloroflexales bacterium]|nr:protein kinase [Chloroflexales bacterium]